jgi:hypothetical protein
MSQENVEIKVADTGHRAVRPPICDLVPRSVWSSKVAAARVFGLGNVR